ncbi:prenyltransferase/squalene oxidase repeat-containing protein [Draconibacterium sp. IB214405]|uniref:prenyltransferase/squalene oxidase repeat-containing protein n=1 Tax=Draconibacterium sp. IB214405 TaxID=3097352 RepID=UPI002A14340A|nr:prenyltransferase/squalene oxidase repeat-containing protein [Draconibacterium sp. IB214405]MDX8338636.1 prenyltransferase/squalene oxidase repeat-containing protein [Draconibacterium sp. IB214405]
MNKEKLEIRFKELSDILLDELNDDGFWSGELSSSALGVAVAVAALHFHDASLHQQEITKGLKWLSSHQNKDGGFGDTPESPANISTSLLSYAALNLYAENNSEVKTTQQKLADYLLTQNVDVRSDQVAKVILDHYQKDYTFSVPILTLCALCGIPGDDGFNHIPQLPFELALLPRKFYRLLNLSVVSYAIPALIAVGIVVFRKKKTNGITRAIRAKAEKKALKILERSLPESGGFLEAIPLTAFVALSLINAGLRDSVIVDKGIAFLKRTQREDGSWPIDIDLSTWVTTLSVKALGDRKNEILSETQQKRIVNHLISVQNKTIHPFNGTSPGGWGWTNYSGSVPDCDDTPGAILALLDLAPHHTIREEILVGGEWLLQLQNNDGGFPTFSRGWGKLPFDQSCADLTGHCVLALAKLLHVYKPELKSKQKKQFTTAINKAVDYLEKHQKENGSWLPLWFGNQHTKSHENPVYGTARVLTYFQKARLLLNNEPVLTERIHNMIVEGTNFLLSVQNEDGSWGGDFGIEGSIEETALAVAALNGIKSEAEIEKGLDWLNDYYKKNGLKKAPIGLYFASLWYDEKLYPLTAYLEAIKGYTDSN